MYTVYFKTNHLVHSKSLGHHRLEPPNFLILSRTGNVCNHCVDGSWKLIETYTYSNVIDLIVHASLAVQTHACNMCPMFHELTFWCGGVSRGIALKGDHPKRKALFQPSFFKGLLIFRWVHARVRPTRICKDVTSKRIEVMVWCGDSLCRAARSWWGQFVPIFGLIGRRLFSLQWISYADST